MADSNDDVMTVEVRFWPADMSLIGKTVTWPREQAVQAIRDYRAVEVTDPAPGQVPPPTHDDTAPAGEAEARTATGEDEQKADAETEAGSAHRTRRSK